MVYTVRTFNYMFVSVDMPCNAYNESQVNIVIFLKLNDPCTGLVLFLHIFVVPSITLVYASIQSLIYTTILAVKCYTAYVLLHLLPKMN